MKQSFVRNLFQQFLNRFNKNQSSDLYEEQPSIIIRRPDTRFRVLDSFKKQGLYFIDLETGEDIDGLMDLPSIGLTFSPPPVETKKPGFGFLSLGQNTGPKNDDSDSFELDAVLFFEYDGPECKTGILENELAYLFFIKVWNDIDLISWEKIIENVIKDLTIKVDDLSYPIVKFAISTTFISNNPGESKKLTISKKKRSGDTEAVSSHFIEEESDDFENDNDDYRILKPRF